jgi:hypothetical protein
VPSLQGDVDAQGESVTIGTGLHRIPAAEYHADPAPEPSLSAGAAHTIVTQSSLHCWHGHPKLNPNWKPKQNAVLDKGSVAHEVLLGGESRIVAIDPQQYAGTRGGIPKGWTNDAIRAARDAAWANGGIPVLLEDLAEINVMVEAARKFVSESELAGVFADGDPELTMLWQEGKIWCRARPDWLTGDKRITVDYKSTATSADPGSFVRQILNMGYDYSVGHYRRGFAALGLNPNWIFLVQENEPPYACSLIGMAPAALDLADRKADYALTLWKSCMASGKWKGYPSRVCYAEPPEYAVHQFEERSMLTEMLENGLQA